MRPWVVRLALWAPILVAAALIAAYVMVHRPFASDSTELVQVPLSEADPGLDTVGELTYLGGLDIPRMGQNIGGLSGLRWDEDSQRLLAITDDARWVWITPDEQDGRLVGLGAVESGDLLGPGGERLSGKEAGDSEALVREDTGPWAVAFERDHRILVYNDGLVEPPIQSVFEPQAELGALEDNRGIEAFALGDDSQLICAERLASIDRANCVLYTAEDDSYSEFPVSPPADLIALGSVPTDADVLPDGSYLVLFRSYDPSRGNSAALVAYNLDGSRREIMTMRAPFTVDNFEGVAVRQVGDQTFLYVVSDDNFSGGQRTLLMKFELRSE